MQIYGTSHIHSAQSLNAPHRSPTANAVSRPSQGVDELDISSEADFVSQVRDLPEIRQDRVDSIRAQIQAGTYETSEKLDAALSRLLDEIA